MGELALETSEGLRLMLRRKPVTRKGETPVPGFSEGAGAPIPADSRLLGEDAVRIGVLSALSTSSSIICFA